MVAKSTGKKDEIYPVYATANTMKARTGVTGFFLSSREMHQSLNSSPTAHATIEPIVLSHSLCLLAFYDKQYP